MDQGTEYHSDYSGFKFCESIKGPLTWFILISSIEILVLSMSYDILFDQLVQSSKTAAEVAFDREHLVAHAHQYCIDL